MNPFFSRGSRSHIEGLFTTEELGLAFRNVSTPLEALRDEVTPLGLHYTLSHFDIPALDRTSFRLELGGRVRRALSLSLAEIQSLPGRTLRVTLECAGNGRAGFSPRYPSMPWMHGAVGTADWTGVSLRSLLEDAGLEPGASEVAFFGADRGFDSGVEHAFARSLALEDATRSEVLLAWAMNGSPLSLQHGAPLRLVVPGWFGMASVKWLVRIAVLDRRFEGYQQAVGYHYRRFEGDPGEPVRHLRVKSLMVPPGIPDWYTRRRLVDTGAVRVEGRAWSTTQVERVQLGVNGVWRDAALAPPGAAHAWQHWQGSWDAEPGEYELACRATDASGAVQPDEPEWNATGMGNNSLHRLQITVR